MTTAKTRKLTDKQYWSDLSERVFWTCVQGAVAAISVDTFELPVWLVIPIATGLAALKGLVAKKLGEANSASTLYEV